MRKIEFVSLALLASAIVVLVVALQMDYGNARKWLTWLSLGLMVLSIDPKHTLQLRRKKDRRKAVLVISLWARKCL